MSTINKKPYIIQVLESITIADITRLKTLINTTDEDPMKLSLVPYSPKLLTASNMGINHVTLELYGTISQKLYTGYLIYNNDYCVLIAYFSRQQQLTLIDMTKEEGNDLWQFKIRPCELSITELRSELDDLVKEEGMEAVEAVSEALENGSLKIKDEYIESGAGVAVGKELVADGNGGAEWGVGIAYAPFKSTWPTSGTTKAFCDAVNADTEAALGMVYAGELTCSDLPFVGNADAKVEVIGDANRRVVHLVITSGNVSPYRWEYTYWNNGVNVSGWQGFEGEIKSFELSASEHATLVAGNTFVLASSDDRYKLLQNNILRITVESTSIAMICNKLINTNGVIAFTYCDYSALTNDVKVAYLIFTPGTNQYTVSRILKEVKDLAKEAIEGATAGTIVDSLGLDSSGNLVKGSAGMRIVELNSASGTLTDEEFAILSGNNGCVHYSGFYLYKMNNVEYCSQTVVNGNPGYNTFNYRMSINTSTKGYLISQSYVAGNVEANPGLYGTESELVSERIGQNIYIIGKSLAYLTTAPTAANTSGRLQVVVLGAEPATRYDGYLYIITEPDPVLANNSWDTIRAVCEAGDAGNYWSVGDTKTDVGTDGYTRTFRIVDMSGLYSKHVVFEQVGLEGTDGTGTTGVQWDAGNYDDYSASDMNVTVLPSVVTRYSSELQNTLTNTTVKVAENGNSSTLVDVTNKLFLEAEKEVFGSQIYGWTAEANALTQYAYWSTHNQASDRIKYDSTSTARQWWLRSPVIGGGMTNYVCCVHSNGDANIYDASDARRFSPCFSF